MIGLTNANKEIDNLFTNILPKLKDLENNLIPSIKYLKKTEKNLINLHKTLTQKQNKELDHIGYTVLSYSQRKLLYYDILPRKHFYASNFFLSNW